MGTRKICLLCACTILALLWAGCSRGEEQVPPEGKEEAMTINLTSMAFAEGEAIPPKYTADGEDVSPPLKWDSAPEGVKSFALICDDPDAPVGTWVHWVLYDLPADIRKLPEAVPTTETISGGGAQGTNDFKRIGYGGPAPPKGAPHRYYFKLYALDAELGLAPRATKADLLRAMEGKILAEAQLMGTYQRE